AVKRREHLRLAWVFALSGVLSCAATQATESSRTPYPARSPSSPAEMRAKGIEGVVVMALTVLPDGSAADIVVMKSAGPEFDRAATEAMSCARFTAAMRDGVVLPSRIHWTYRFQLDREEQHADR